MEESIYTINYLEQLRGQWLNEFREDVREIGRVVLITGLDLFERTTDPRLLHDAKAWFSEWRQQGISYDPAIVDVTVSRYKSGQWLSGKGNYAETMHVTIKSKIDQGPWPKVADVWISDDPGIMATHKNDQFIVPGPWLKATRSFIANHQNQEQLELLKIEQGKANQLAKLLLIGEPNMGLEYKYE